MYKVIGIDLGTSNSAVAGVLQDDNVELVSTIQVAGFHTIDSRTLLPSVWYMPATAEFSEDSLRLPWAESRQPLVGLFAKELSALNPGRAVISAKSWLSNHLVDRHSAVLPWGEDTDLDKVSPVAATVCFLEHLKKSLEFKAEKSINTEIVVLTVPASFDEVARTLTYEASQTAGWGNVVLLEEPTAAFYSWISENESNWRDSLEVGDIVLVCDVGGGTSDFSLISVNEKDGQLELERLSVGEHILLGGDNMDLALAYSLSSSLSEVGTDLDNWQFMSLVQQARIAKEKMFADPSIDQLVVSVAGKGTSLFSSAVSVTVDRRMLESIILDGFLPLSDIQNLPEADNQHAIQEFGLPYARDPVITKHLAKFLTDSWSCVRQLKVGSVEGLATYAKPTAVLFNGGVFASPVVRQRLIEILKSWGCEGIKELASGDLQTSVARGAAYYGRLATTSSGIRIRAGIPRSYYLGIEKAMPAVPGIKPPIQGLCIAPRGTEEGSSLRIKTKEFGLRLGQSAEFKFFSSNTRADDQLGTLVERPSRVLSEHSPVKVSLSSVEQSGTLVPVQLRVEVTPIGILELWMEEVKVEGRNQESHQRELEDRSGNRWKLEFDLRSAENQGQ